MIKDDLQGLEARSRLCLVCSRCLEPSSTKCIVKCAAKRPKGLVPEAGTKCDDIVAKRFHHFHDINNLPDEILEEIICRLPSCKSVIQCKHVCKRWYSMIWRPDFLRLVDSMKAYKRCCILFHFRTEVVVSKVGPLCGTNIVFGLESASLHVMYPKSDSRAVPPDVVVGAHNDLLLYCTDNKSHKSYDFSICNIQTKQRIQLPSPPFYDGVHVLFGLFCDPYYCTGVDGSAGRYRLYSVVVVPVIQNLVTECKAHFFSSSNNQWSERTLSIPKPFRLDGWSRAFAYRGKIHFLGIRAAIGFNPFADDHDGVVQCHFFSWPRMFCWPLPGIGVCHQNLVVSNFDMEAKRLGVWLLKDYIAGEWCCLHDVSEEDVVSFDPSLHGWPLDKRSEIGYVLGIHPTDSDVIYLVKGSEIRLCNLRERTLEVVAQFPARITPPSIKSIFYPFSLELPSWPTKISAPGVA